MKTVVPMYDIITQNFMIVFCLTVDIIVSSRTYRK